MLQSITKTLLLIALIIVTSAGTGRAEGYDHATVYDSAGQIVRTTEAECLQTRWITDHDPCAAKVVTTTERTVQQTKVVHQAPKIVKTSELTQDEKTVYFVFNKALLTEEGRKRADN